MYLSKCRIDPQCLINPYQVHQLLWKQFSDDPQGSRPFLYQMERLGRGRGQQGEILMLSTRQPLATNSEKAVTLVASKSYQPRFEPGQILGFRLDANPIKRLKQSQNRVPLIREEEQIAWLLRKLEGVATLAECVVSAKEDLFFRKQGDAGKIAKVRFEGRVVVESVEGMDGVLQHGIGPAKAFGCGLLLLRRV